jgi:transcriptional regulator with XRE-family HTH domain
MSKDRLTIYINRRMGSKSALLRAMQKHGVPVERKTIYNWCRDNNSIKLEQLKKLAQAFKVPVHELVKQITIKHEGDE